MHYVSYYNSPYGKMLIAANDRALIGAWFIGQKYFKSTLDKVFVECETPILLKAKSLLDEYFKGYNPSFSIDMELLVSEFTKDVLTLVRHITYGTTITYKDLGLKLADYRNNKKISYQAIGRAIAHNPLLIFIPCHRVIGSDGSLKGFAAGLLIKEKLLKFEANTIINS